MKRIIILGAGGNARDVIELIEDINTQNKKYNCIGLLDDDRSLLGKKISGVEVLGKVDAAKKFSDCLFVNGVYTISDILSNKKVIDKSNIPTSKFESLVHPSANVYNSVRLGLGCVIMQSVTVMSNCRVGQHVIIQPGSVISHDNVIDDYSFIANSVATGGYAAIGESCFLGMNSTIREKVKIGNRSVVGMGSVVLDDIPSRSVYVGNPAKFLKKIL